MAKDIIEIPSETRNSNIEIFRLVLMIAIFFWHIIMHGYGFKSIGSELFRPEGNLVFITFCLSLFAPATYCFMFISGWYGIKFSWRKLLYFVVLAFSCFLLSILCKFLLFGEFSLYYFLTSLFPIANGVWWFLTGYVLVFIISPFIEIGFERLPAKTVRIVLILMTFMEVARFSTFKGNTGSDFFGLLYIYMLARFIRNSNTSFSLKSLFLLYLSSLLLLWGACWATARLNAPLSRLSFAVLSYCNPLIIIMAVTSFLMVIKIKPTNIPWLNRITHGILAIYLLTEAIMQDKGYIEVYQIFKTNSLMGVLTIVLIMVICLAIGIAISRLTTVIEKSRLFRQLCQY